MSRSSEDPGEIHSLNSIRGPSLKILRDTVCTFSSTPLGSVNPIVVFCCMLMIVVYPIVVFCCMLIIQ